MRKLKPRPGRRHKFLVVYGYQHHSGGMGEGNVDVYAETETFTLEEIREMESNIRLQVPGAGCVVIRNLIRLR